MKPTQWTFNIPDVVKHQVENGLGEISVSYSPQEIIEEGCLNIKVIKTIHLYLTVNEYQTRNKIHLSWTESKGPFEDWFKIICDSIDIV